MSSNITTRIQELSLRVDEATHRQVNVVTTPQPDDTQIRRRGYRRRATDPTQVNSSAARKRCMYYGFYGGEDAIQKMMMNCFPEELQGRKPYDPNLFLAAIEFIRNVTGRPDIGVHSAYVGQRNKGAIPSIGLEVGEQTFIVGLFPLEREAYMNRITQENVDMLEEFFGTTPSWWEISQIDRSMYKMSSVTPGTQLAFQSEFEIECAVSWWRNPRLAYACYIESMGTDAAGGLRAMKKDLRCPGLTPFLRCQMLWRGTGHAGREGLRILQEARAEGAAFLVSAWEDAKTFIVEAPPDTRHMLGMLGWYVLLTAVVRGPELSADLRELDPARRKIRTATDFMKWMGYPIRKTQMNLTRELILELYTPGAMEWGDLVGRFDEQDRFVEESETRPSAAQAEDELAAWLGDIDLDEEHGHDHNHNHNHHAHGHGARRANAPSDADKGTRGYELYRCLWCRNPSAVLRKCGGCAKTRYCDSGCQKLHWAEHKSDCEGKKK